MELTPFQHDHADAVVALWRRSFEHGTGLADPHPLHEQRHFLLTQIAPRCTVAVAWMPGGPADRVPAGFIAHTTGTVEQLYVDPPWMGQGIGTALLQRAQSAARAAGVDLVLHTLARNTAARAFYARRGFVEEAHGWAEMWGVADVRCRWRPLP
jgi:GNAT superfamily N-acetyltransferase